MLPLNHTKLTPPQPGRHTLYRSRLTRRLLDVRNYRLGIVQAGTGFGKTTAAAGLMETDQRCLWYHLSKDDADTLVFLVHLVHGFQKVVPGFSLAAAGALESWQRNQQPAQALAVIDILVNELTERQEEPLFLILDDAHQLLASKATMNLLGALINHRPPHLHLLLLTRYPLHLPDLLSWRMREELLQIDQAELAFTPAEISDLFHKQYGIEIDEVEVNLLSQRVEGWPIALPLIWQRLRRNRDRSLPEILGQLSGSTSDLFTWLVQEVIANQPLTIQRFLRETAVLRQLTVERCNGLRGQADSHDLLQTLLERALFVVNLENGHCRYHHLFREILLNQQSQTDLQKSHRRAAQLAREAGEVEDAIYHHLAAQDFSAAAAMLSDHGRGQVRSGRLDTLSDWLTSLPPDILASFPNLMSYMGDIARLRSRFDEAQEWYEQAIASARQRQDRQSLGQALRGQAKVYLDTVNPSRAEAVLQEALRLADGIEDRQSQARLLQLMAENLLNRGRLKEAESYQAQAKSLSQEGPSEADLPARLLLRTGRLDEALKILLIQAEQEEKDPVLRPRAHRETMLLLSLILAFKGDQPAAYRYAIRGTERGQQLRSDFITAVGWMRQGHAHLLTKTATGYEHARLCFQKAIRLSESLLVPRLKVEAFWGLTQAYGFQGDLASAQEMAEAGLSIALDAGDEWIAAGLHLALGAGQVLGDHSQAPSLTKALNGFEESGDRYGETVTLMWLCLLWHKIGDTVRLQRDLDVWLTQMRRYDFGFMVWRRVLLGPPDPRQLVPLLLTARDQEIQATYARELLLQAGINPMLEVHPGYQLKIQTLGQFRLWCGLKERPARVWKRQKSRQLFQLLLTIRDTMLDREQIIELLWPESDPAGGERDFKIAYTTLLKVLEPDRARHAPSAFIHRDGTRYGLRQEGDIALDVVEFEKFVATADQEGRQRPKIAINHYEAALKRYEGDFLQEFPYEPWATEERERLLMIYLRAAERLGRLLIGQSMWEQVIPIAEQILNRDDCREEGYRLLMQAYAALGERPLALRVYQRCQETLLAELDVKPTPLTQALHHAILLDGGPQKAS